MTQQGKILSLLTTMVEQNKIQSQQPIPAPPPMIQQLSLVPVAQQLTPAPMIEQLHVGQVPKVQQSAPISTPALVQQLMLPQTPRPKTPTNTVRTFGNN